MKFVAHNHYNNNAYVVHGLKSKNIAWTGNDFNMTDSGVTYLLVPKKLDIDEKLDFMGRLHFGLMRKFGHGLSGVTCSSSDCVQAREIQPFFDHAKALDPHIKTIWNDSKHSDGGWISAPKNLKVDHILNYNDPDVPKQLAKAVGADELDAMARPPAEWNKLEQKIRGVYADVNSGKLNPSPVVSRAIGAVRRGFSSRYDP
jgi:hypothetical protein